ncbi:MAG: ABC transporter permease [Clostridiaceae bacterium]
MTLFKYFLKLAWRQKYVILLYLLLFVVISLLNSGASRPQSGAFSESRPSIKVIQKDSGPLAERLAQYLKTQGREDVSHITEDQAEEAIFKGAATSVVIIPETFTKNFLAGTTSLTVYTDDTQMSAVLLRQKIQQYLMFLKADQTFHGTADPARVEAALAVRANVVLDHPETAGNGDSWFRYYFNFMTYIVVAIFIMVFSNIMNEFNEDNLKRRNAIVPFSSTRFQGAMVLGQLLIAFGITALFLIIGAVIRPQEAGSLNWPGHIANASAFTLAALAMAFLVNALTRNRFIQSALATVLSLALSFISGVMVPQEFLSSSVVTLSKFFPSYYYVRATDQILQNASYLPQIGIQLLFALFFLVLGLTAIRIRQGEDLLFKKNQTPLRPTAS